jgi:hypothetical protein
VDSGIRLFSPSDHEWPPAAQLVLQAALLGIGLAAGVADRITERISDHVAVQRDDRRKTDIRPRALPSGARRNYQPYRELRSYEHNTSPNSGTSG